MTNEEFLKLIEEKFEGRKAIFTDSGLASAGLLNAKQADKFIQETIEKTLVRNECRRETGAEKQVDIDKIAFADMLIQTPSAEGTKHTTTTAPSTSKVQVATVEYIIAVDLGYSALRNSIEKANFENNLMKLIANKAGSDLEAVALNSNTATGAGVYDDNAGWFQQAATGALAHIVNHASADAFNTTYKTARLFDNMLDSLPKKYLDSADLKAWRFYTHVDIEWLYRRWLTAIGSANSAAFNYLIDNVPVFYQGIPVKGVPRLSRTSAGSPAYYVSSALLCEPQNLIEYIQTDIQFVSENVPRARTVEITGTINIDWQVEEVDALVETNLIKHNLGTA